MKEITLLNQTQLDEFQKWMKTNPEITEQSYYEEFMKQRGIPKPIQSVQVQTTLGDN